jgi:hypothetical protein
MQRSGSPSVGPPLDKDMHSIHQDHNYQVIHACCCTTIPAFPPLPRAMSQLVVSSQRSALNCNLEKWAMGTPFLVVSDIAACLHFEYYFREVSAHVVQSFFLFWSFSCGFAAAEGAVTLLKVGAKCMRGMVEERSYGSKNLAQP